MKKRERNQDIAHICRQGAADTFLPETIRRDFWGGDALSSSNVIGYVSTYSSACLLTRRTLSLYNTCTPSGVGGYGMRQCMDAENLHRRLKKIIGQVQAIDRMIDQDIPCEEILSQINAAKSALNGCGKVVLEGHIKHCVRDGIEHGDAEKTIESFTKAVERFANMQ